jgi:prevent-host-death family protein
MADIIVPVHELKAKLSEYIARAVHGNERILVSRHDKPVALLIGMEAAEKEPPYKPTGLESIDWEEFSELGEALQIVYEGRHGEEYREVSL